ncbi:hypothetical protein [Thalassovita gelatinovora]|nr:hypothetical protein [Thalassovita gelatinovora]QIZ79053.1 hypothetical protein HFZ77_00470 [Thalassovita gelatinovora]
MTFHAQFDRLRVFLAHLELIDMDAQKDAFMNEGMETGDADLILRADTKSSHLIEIRLHGATAFGATEDEAIRNWKKVARQLLPGIEDDGFVTGHPPIGRLPHRVLA